MTEEQQELDAKLASLITDKLDFAVSKAIELQGKLALAESSKKLAWHEHNRTKNNLVEAANLLKHLRKDIGLSIESQKLIDDFLTCGIYK